MLLALKDNTISVEERKTITSDIRDESTCCYQIQRTQTNYVTTLI